MIRKDRPSALSWRTLLAGQAGIWWLAFALGFFTLLAVVGLLTTSGWFISATAIAGLSMATAYSFNYFSPAALIRLAAIVRTAGRYGERLASHYAVLGLLKDLRLLVFARLSQTSPLKLWQLGSGDLAQRLVGDIDHLDAWPLRFFLPWLWASSLLLLFIALLAWLQPLLLLPMLPGLLFAWLLVPSLGAWQGYRLAKQESQQLGKRRQDLLQLLRNQVSLQVFGQWALKQEQFLSQDQQLILEQQRLTQIQQLCQLASLAGLGLSLIMGLYTGVHLVASGLLAGPWLVACLLAILGLQEVLLPQSGSFIALGQAAGAKQRISELLPEAAAQTVAGQTFASLELVNLSARMPGALNGPSQLNCHWQLGDRVWLRGPSGCGKSTLCWVLSGQLPAEQGQLLLNGKALTALPENWLGQQLGLQLQDNYCFHLSLAENLRLAKADASDEQLWQALEAMELADWAKQLPKGLNSQMSEQGRTLSGGQLRRLGLARLWLQQPSIWLLDEGLEGLDPQMSQRILKRICSQECLLIVISHQQLDSNLFSQIVTLDERGRCLDAS